MLDDVLDEEDGKSPHEPDEYDPEADLRDYESELTPSVRIPEAPSPGSTEIGDIPGDLQRKFWTLVLAFNAALLGVSLGAMFVVFRNDWTMGGRLLLGGAVCAAYGFYRLKTWDMPTGDGSMAVTSDDEDAEDANGDDDSDADADADSDPDTEPATDDDTATDDND